MEFWRTHPWNIFCCWCCFITEVESLDVRCNWTSTDWYHYWYYCFGYILYFSILSSILILITVCFVILVFNYHFHFVSSISHLNKYIVMTVFISIFTINLSYKDIHFCLLKLSFVFLQWFYIRHHILIQIAMLIINY